MTRMLLAVVFGLVLARGVLAQPAAFGLPPAFLEIVPGEWRMFPGPAFAARDGVLSVRSHENGAGFDLDLPAWRVRAEDFVATRYTRIDGAGTRTLAGARSIAFEAPDGRASLIVEAGGGGLLELRWQAASAAELAAVSLRIVPGRDSASVADEDALFALPPDAPLRWVASADGARRLVASSHSAEDASLLVFKQPVLLGTFLGGAASREEIRSLMVTADGQLLAAGWTVSSDFPTTPGAFDPDGKPTTDGFIASLSLDGSTMIFGTFFGGSGIDGVEELVVDFDGSVVFAGTTGSADLPVTIGAFDTSFNGVESDGYVARLSGDGSTLSQCTYLGGSSANDEHILRLLLDPADGTILVAGRSCSADFPTTPGAFSQTKLGTCDGFVTRLTSDLTSLVASTFVSDSDWIADMLVHTDGNVIVAGHSVSDFSPFTVVNSPFAGLVDSQFLLELSADLSTLVWSSPTGAAVHVLRSLPDGSLVFVGSTNAAAFPTTPGAFSQVYMGEGHAEYVAAAVSGDAQTLLWGTFINTEGFSIGPILDLALDEQGRLFFCGQISTSNYPFTADALDTKLTGLSEGVFTVLDPTGSDVLYATLLGIGGSFPSSATALALDGCNGAYIAGTTTSSSFPTTPGSFDPTYNGGPGGDAWIVRLIALNPWADLGGSLASPSADPRLLPIGALCDGEPTTLSVDAGPSLGTAFLAIGASQIAAPFKGGVFVPTPDLLVGPLPLDRRGDVAIAFAWPPGLPTDLDLFYQAWMPDASALLGFVATNGVRGRTP